MRRACKYDWFLSWRGLLLRLPCFQPYGIWLFVLMKSPSRSFKFPATPLNGLCDNLPSCLQLLFNLDPSNPLCPLTVTPPKQFSQWIQLFQPAPKSVNLCVLFSEQSTDSQSRLPSQQSSLPCQQSWQSTQPTLYFFGIFWCGLSSSVLWHQAMRTSYVCTLFVVSTESTAYSGRGLGLIFLSFTA